jgi:hypothetical protein
MNNASLIFWQHFFHSVKKLNITFANFPHALLTLPSLIGIIIVVPKQNT